MLWQRKNTWGWLTGKKLSKASHRQRAASLSWHKKYIPVCLSSLRPCYLLLWPPIPLGSQPMLWGLSFNFPIKQHLCICDPKLPPWALWAHLAVACSAGSRVVNSFLTHADVCLSGYTGFPLWPNSSYCLCVLYMFLYILLIFSFDMVLHKQTNKQTNCSGTGLLDELQPICRTAVDAFSFVRHRGCFKIFPGSLWPTSAHFSAF